MKDSAAFVDSNIVLYLISGDTRKSSEAERLLQNAPKVSVQVLNEFVSVARRKHKVEWQTVVSTLDLIHSVCEVLPLTPEAQILAVHISKNAMLDIYDANIVASAELAGCTVLYTEDLNHRQRIGRVEIRNPFTEE